MTEEENKQEKKEFTVVQVATEHQPTIELKDGTHVSFLEVLAEIANDVKEMKKATIGN